MKFVGADQRYVGAMGVAVEIVFLLGDDNSHLLFFDKNSQQRDQAVAKSIVITRVARHVDKFSIHQLMVVGEGGGKALELFNRDTGSGRHKYYCTLPNSGPIREA